MIKRKNLKSVLVNNIIFLLLILISTEIVFRIIGIPYSIKYIPHENTFGRFDPEIGWSYIPNTSTTQKVGDITTPVYFDENGIRVPGPDTKLDPSKPSVLFIGCSITMGHGLSYEDNFVGKFGALKEVPFQVVNVGVQGYGSDQTLLALKRYLPKFNTKVVVYTFFEDHIKRNGVYDRRLLIPSAKFLGTKPLFALDNKGELYEAKEPVLYKNYINSWIYDFYKIRLGSRLGFFPPYPEALTKALIREMKRYSNEHGAHFVILNWRWTTDYYDNLHDLDIDIIDTIEDAPEGWDKMTLIGGIHPNPQAGDHAAQLLLNYFQEKGLLKNDSRK